MEGMCTSHCTAWLKLCLVMQSRVILKTEKRKRWQGEKKRRKWKQDWVKERGRWSMNLRSESIIRQKKGEWDKEEGRKWKWCSESKREMECECKRSKRHWEVQARKSDECVKKETEREIKWDGDTRRPALLASVYSQWSVDRFNKSCVL